jgi:hypothetical protein
MPKSKKTPADLAVAAEALEAALGQARFAESGVRLVDKYAEKIPGARGHLVQFYAEAFGAFCDDLARGYRGWAHSATACPNCDADLHAVRVGTESVLTCGSCGYSETR